jgi:hypothetical protein
VPAVPCLQNCVVQRRTNKYRLMDSAQEVQRRLVTWDGPELLSETMPLSGAPRVPGRSLTLHQHLSVPPLLLSAISESPLEIMHTADLHGFLMLAITPTQ